MKSLDRYSLLCISISLIILLMLFINADEPQDKDIIGTAFDIRTSQNGYTFSVDDTDGDITRCFARIEPSEFGIYLIKGKASDDGSMFFVSSMQEIHQNEF